MKIKIIVMLILSLVLFASCSKNKEIENNSPVAKFVESSLNERGVSFGMTEEEVIAAETLNFLTDTDPYATYVTENYTRKTIYSETTTKFGDYDAIITYHFYNNLLYYMEYSIDVNYTDTEALSSPAYAVFLDFSLKYTDILGNPNISEANNDGYVWDSYNNIWTDSEDAEEAKYIINLFTHQSTYKSYKDEYSDTVHILFAGGFNEFNE